MERLRDAIEHRPLVVFVLALSLGITVPTHPYHAGFLGLMLLFFQTDRSWIISLVASVLGVCIAPLPAIESSEAVSIRDQVQVVSVPREGAKTQSFLIQSNSLRLLATAPLDAEIHKGERWQLVVKAKPLSETIAPFMRAQGVQGSIRWPGTAKRISEGPFIYRWSDAWRKRFAKFSDEILMPDDARWIQALCFRSGAMQPEERDALVRTGTVHLVAASGLHVGVLAALLFTVLRWVPIGRPLQLVIIGFVLCLYCLATGLHMPTVRAVCSLMVGCSAYLVKRDPDALSALALGSGGYLLFDPAAIYSVGFQLSFCIVTTLILFLPRLKSKERNLVSVAKTYVLEGSVLSMLAAVVGEPILAAHTGVLSLTNIPANMVAVLPACAAIWIAFLAFGVSFVSLAAAKPLMAAVASLTMICRWAIVGLDRFAWTHIVVPSFSSYLLIPLYGLLLFAWRPRVQQD